MSDRVKKPFVIVGLPLFALNCVVSGFVMGIGLGKLMSDQWYGFPLIMLGLVWNILGFVLRNQTRTYQLQERIDRMFGRGGNA